MKNASHILVVDDESSIRTVLRITLESSGYTVTDAANGQHALRLIKTVRFDLIVLDYNMPIIDGASVMAELAQLDQRPPVIVLTAYGSIALTTRMMRLGAADFLEKPIVPDDLLASIGHVLSAQPGPTVPPAAFDVPGVDPHNPDQVLTAVRRALVADHLDVAETLLRQLANTVPTAAAKAPYLNLKGLLSELRGRLLAARALYRMASTTAQGHRYLPLAENAWRLYDLLRAQPRDDAKVSLGEPEEIHQAFGAAGLPPKSPINRLKKLLLDHPFAVTAPHMPRPDRS